MPRLDLHRDRYSVFSNGWFHGQLGDIPLEVVFLLPTVLIEPLPEIALTVKQTDTDQWNIQVGSALDMVARKDAESAGVNRNRFMQPEFRGEIRHWPRPQNTRVGRAPGPIRLKILL